MPLAFSWNQFSERIYFKVHSNKWTGTTEGAVVLDSVNIPGSGHRAQSVQVEQEEGHIEKNGSEPERRKQGGLLSG